jgi:hypothetical protein
MAGKAWSDLQKCLRSAKFRVLGRSFDRLVKSRPW